MTTAFQKAWDTPTTYKIWEVANSRYVSETGYQPYLDWLAAGNVPENISGDRFILIDANGNPYWDPNKDAILAAEEYARLHPEPAMEATLAGACNMLDSIMLGGSKRGAYYDYVLARWYTRDFTADELSTLVNKKFITAAERTAIMAIEQVPLEG